MNEKVLNKITSFWMLTSVFYNCKEDDTKDGGGTKM